MCITQLDADISKQYKNKKVLVLGADGFLGSNCVQALFESGARISILSRRAAPVMKSCARHIFQGDLKDVELAEQMVVDHDIIFDFLGTTGAVDSNTDAYANFQIECQPHLNLFKACADLNPNVVIMFCSSRLVYGKPSYLPVDEQHPISPESLYAVHKVTLEHYLKIFHKLSGLRYCILRLTNPYGPAPNTTLKKNTYGIINIFIRLALANEPLTIFGDGRQLRDFIHVADALTAFLTCAVTPKCYGQIFNLGGTQKISLQEAAQTITDICRNRPIRYVDWPDEYKLIETGDYYSNIDKLLSYVDLPRQMSFYDSIKKTVQYFMHGIKA